jgi:hypothetical protein
MGPLLRLEGERKSGAIRYFPFRQSLHDLLEQLTPLPDRMAPLSE